MDCKRALEETGGDLEAAQKLLRERGIGAGRQARGPRDDRGQGRLRIADDGARARSSRVGCETEPVSNNEEFLAFAEKVLRLVDAEGSGCRRAARGGARRARRQARREHRRRWRRRGSRRSTAARSPATRIRPRTSWACSCRCAAATPELARAASRCTSRRRRRSGWRARTSPRTSSPPSARSTRTRTRCSRSRSRRARRSSRACSNKRFFAAQVLTEQPWIHDTGKTVGQALVEEGAEVLEFERFALAG